MPTKPASTPVEEIQDDLNTKWEVFARAKLIPSQIICDTIFGHPGDEACHTKLELRAPIMVKHVIAHGGGFRITVRQSDGKIWPGWKQLEDARMELASLKCEVCDQEIGLSVRELDAHLRQTHQGKFRGANQMFKNQLFLRIQPHGAKIEEPEIDDGAIELTDKY